MTNDTKNVWGLRLEFYGLVAVLVATFWQATFTDVLDQLGYEWQSYIQEDVNFAVLDSLEEMAFLMVEDSAEKRREKARKIYQIAGAARSKAITERNQRKGYLGGQAHIFEWIRNAFLIAGAVAFAIGKWLTLVAARARRDCGLRRSGAG